MVKNEASQDLRPVPPSTACLDPILFRLPSFKIIGNKGEYTTTTKISEPAQLILWFMTKVQAPLAEQIHK